MVLNWRLKDSGWTRKRFPPSRSVEPMWVEKYWRQSKLNKDYGYIYKKTKQRRSETCMKSVVDVTKLSPGVTYVPRFGGGVPSTPPVESHHASELENLVS